MKKNSLLSIKADGQGGYKTEQHILKPGKVRTIIGQIVMVIGFLVIFAGCANLHYGFYPGRVAPFVVGVIVFLVGSGLSAHVTHERTATVRTRGQN